mmetsp:Transcript_19817/g.43339  ORF Transcript_19817/g.43339 Transcript_19817/m.43339 type:complete len:315 (+) Transcript_19817:214-1158(+)
MREEKIPSHGWPCAQNYAQAGLWDPLRCTSRAQTSRPPNLGILPPHPIHSYECAPALSGARLHARPCWPWFPSSSSLPLSQSAHWPAETLRACLRILLSAAARGSSAFVELPPLRTTASSLRKSAATHIRSEVPSLQVQLRACRAPHRTPSACGGTCQLVRGELARCPGRRLAPLTRHALTHITAARPPGTRPAWTVPPCGASAGQCSAEMGSSLIVIRSGKGEAGCQLPPPPQQGTAGRDSPGHRGPPLSWGTGGALGPLGPDLAWPSPSCTGQTQTATARTPKFASVSPHSQIASPRTKPLLRSWMCRPPLE